MSINSFFHSNPLFRYEEFLRWKAEQGTSSPRAARKALQYHTKAGHLINVRRGIYAVVPPNELADELLVDPYLLAAKISNDSVLAYHSALELHGVAYSAFEQFTFLTSQKIKSFHFRGQWFQPAMLPLALKKKNSNQEFGIELVNRQGLDIAVTDFARTFVDVLDRIELSGGWEEVIRSISNMAILDVNEVITYCLMLNNRILAAKVGFFLEQRKDAFIVSNDILQPLLDKKPSTPQSLVRKREQGQLIKKWNLILPSYVVNKSWEEPNYDV